MLTMNQQAYMSIMGELLNLWRLAGFAALAAVPNETEYADNFAILVRKEGFGKQWARGSASQHRATVAQFADA